MAQFRFSIDYFTQWGESLCIRCLTGNGTHIIPLSTNDGKTWQGEISGPTDAPLVYSYCVRNEAGDILRAERDGCRHIAAGRRSRLSLRDHWTERDIPSVFLHSAFTENIFRHRDGAEARMELLAEPYILLTRTLPPPADCRWAIVGSSPRTGNWNLAGARFLQRTGVYEWGLPLTSEDFEEGMYYKYVLIGEGKQGQQVVWEEGENRHLAPQPLLKGEAAIVNDDAPRISLPAWRGAGVVIPVFSLRSEGSQGIGDFGDLQHFIQWAASTGHSAVQLLPVNDTTSSGTWGDSYPYKGVSVYALHPIYIDLREWQDTDLFAEHAGRFAQLNGLPELDYEGTFTEKMLFLQKLYGRIGKNCERKAAYKDFCREQAFWLKPYSAYCAKKAKELNFKHGHEEKFHIFVQYLLHRQMCGVRDTARNLGVMLKGDIPIGICRDSVAAQAEPHLFHFNGYAGAPPDAFAQCGQNWGFPTYNWEEMAKDNYAWWRNRLAHMNRYFDAYRIDHVLGFFRIWEIPATQIHGLLGRFRPALPLSEEEIRQAGFNAAIAGHAVPHVTAARLSELEDNLGERGLRRFFTETEEGIFHLKPECDTQRKIEAAVPAGALRDILMEAAANVLFVEDPDKPHHYHPRINGQHTDAFRNLCETDRHAFCRLHDDFFYHRHNRFWADKAMEKLPVITGTADTAPQVSSMLPCAEDLGMVPASVKGVLEELNILSLEIQRMPKHYGRRFDNPLENPYLSVATIATHDMPPFRLWWRKEPEAAQAFWNEALHREGKAPADATPDMCEEVVSMHLESPSMLCLNALQDLLGIDGKLRHPHPEQEQINDPANPHQYWRYRMHLTIEELLGATSFNEKLRSLIARSHRNRH